MIAQAIAIISFFSLFFSINYMKEEKNKFLFFFLMILFTFAMELFLFAKNWLVLFFSWEIMTLCSYFLIGFYERKSSRRAARKALVITRIGSSALLLAIAYIYATEKTLEIGSVPKIAALLILISALSKSSQFPFSWLPDAMEAPTPASALLHAAAMVNAGPILLFKLSENFLFLKPIIFLFSLITLLLSSLSAIQENNLKRILAYSTISSLSILFTLFDSPLFIPFFLIHSFSKASLFFLAGDLSFKGNYELDMGYSRKSIQSFLFLFFSLSIAGFPPLGAFWIKSQEFSLFSLISFILSLSYFLRAYLKVFSGNFRPKLKFGTISALFLFPLSLLSPFLLSTPNLKPALIFLISSPLAYFLLNFEPFFTIFSQIFNIIEKINVRISWIESTIEDLIYRAGLKLQRLSLYLRKLFTGPVSRDVAYIGIVLLLLMLGVIIFQT